MSKLFSDDLVTNVCWSWVNNNDRFMKCIKEQIVACLVPHVARAVEQAFLTELGITADKPIDQELLLALKQIEESTRQIDDFFPDTDCARLVPGCCLEIRMQVNVLRRRLRRMKAADSANASQAVTDRTEETLPGSEKGTKKDPDIPF